MFFKLINKLRFKSKLIMKQCVYLILLQIVFSSTAFAQVSRILIDDDFSDWSSPNSLYNDPTGDAGFSNIDFRLLWASHDDDYLFLRFETGAEILFQQDNNIGLYIDTDNDASTGTMLNGIGADLRYFPGDRSGFVQIDNGSVFSINHYDIGLVSSPTVSSDEFEIAIRRDAQFQGQSLFQGNQIRLLFKTNSFGSGDQMPDEDGGILYTFEGSPSEPLPSYSINKTNVNHLRIFSQNVQTDNLFDPLSQDRFSRILHAVQPEIICYQEIYDFSSAQTASLINSILPSGLGEQWYHAKEGPDNIVLSRYPIIAHSKINGFVSAQGNGAFLLDLQATHGTNLFLIVAHLPCCDNNEERRLEIDNLLQFIRESKAGNGDIPIDENTPIIVTGDMNLVGDQSQQFSLVNGDIQNESIHGPDFSPDWDGSPFVDARLYSTDQPLAVTWVNPFSSFSPGRLDYFLYTGSVMELHNGYTLHTPTLPSDTLNTYNLMASDVLESADHLPMVADVSFLQTTAIEADIAGEHSNEIKLLQNQPNPFQNHTQIQYHLPKSAKVDLLIYDILGNEFLQLNQGQQMAGSHQIEIDATKWAKGFYLYVLKVDNQQLVGKMIVE